MVKDLAVALSLANLSFINAWRGLLVPSAFLTYHQKTPPPPISQFALILDVLIFAALFYIGTVLVRRYGTKSAKRWHRIGFLLILSVTLHALVTQIDDPAVHKSLFQVIGDRGVVERLVASVPLTIALFIFVISLFKVDTATRVGISLSLILSPFVLITFSQATLTAIKNSRVGKAPAAVPLEQKRKSGRPRVLWMIFDELDFRLSFENRPASVALPELDRLVQQSLFAENAYPPAGETFLTMPALITGRLVSEAHRSGSDELIIRFGDDTDPVPWSSQPNFFSRARELGLETALFGWYHPYCRILGNSLTKCSAESGLLVSEGARDWSSHMLIHARTAVLAAPLAPFVFAKFDYGDELRRMHAADFHSTHRKSIEAALDPNIDVVMVHWSIPHHPNIYDRVEDQISVAAHHSYLDNLELVDRTLGEMRRALENNGSWDQTVVLVSSDHWWRADSVWRKRSALTAEDEAALGGIVDRRVPFILKMKGVNEQRITVTNPFNTILSQDLLLAILRGEVSDATAAAAWIENHSTVGRSPYDERSFR